MLVSVGASVGRCGRGGRSWATVVARTDGRRAGSETILHPADIQPVGHCCSVEEEDDSGTERAPMLEL